MPDCLSYSADLCTGGTESASDNYSGYPASNAFDAVAISFWAAAEITGTHWIQYQFASAEQINKIELTGGNPNQGFASFSLLASNTGAFGGEEVTLLTVSGQTWTEFEEKIWEFDNATAYAYYRISGEGPGDFQPAFSKIEMFECLEAAIEASITDGAGIDDVFEVFDYKGVLVEGAALGDEIEAFNLTDSITEGVSIADAMSCGFEVSGEIADAVALSDSFEVGFEFPGEFTEACGITDTFEAFNYSAFLRQYGDLLIRRFYFTLTGAPDSKADAIIPISSFTLRRRNGEPSYLSVAIPSIEYADYVTDRPNGEMVLEVAYLYQGAEVLREEIGRVDLEDVRTDQGARNKSITLSGHKTESFTGQICTLRGVSYKSQSNATWTVRADIEPYARPGDTIRISGVDLFEASLVTMYGAAGGTMQMEVSG